MRRTQAFALALAAATLAGCAAPAPRADFAPSCPAWSPGAASSAFNDLFDNHTATHRDEVLGAGLLRDEGRPLDRVELDFRPHGDTWQGATVRDGRLRLTFHRQDDGAPLVAYDRSLGPQGAANPGNSTWTFGPGTSSDLMLFVDLSAPDAAAGAPTAVVVSWDLVRDIDGDAATPSGAVVAYTATYDYRVC